MVQPKQNEFVSQFTCSQPYLYLKIHAPRTHINTRENDDEQHFNYRWPYLTIHIFRRVTFALLKDRLLLLRSLIDGGACGTVGVAGKNIKTY